MNQQQSIKCNCTPKSEKLFCRKCSAYKMVYLLKYDMDHLKKTQPDGKKVNPVRYSFYSKNRKGIQANIDGMMRRLANEEEMKSSNMVIFYHNGGSEIQSIKL